MSTPKNFIEARHRAEWRRWLAKHHTRAQGVWLVTFKKGSGMPHLDNPGAVEEALCFGWVDSKPAKVDERRTNLCFALRKPGSGWSKLNKERIAWLIDSGAMEAAGLRKIAAAKEDGSWSKLDAVEAIEITSDLARAFSHHHGSAAHFDAFPRSAKRGILESILQAKRSETRARRIGETATLAARNERANQSRRK